PRCMAAASATWNSGRLVSISPTVSPRPTPSAASPAATRSTRCAYSVQVQLTASPFVRSATVSPHSAAVIWKASQTVCASRAAGRSSRAAVVLSIYALLRVARGRSLPDPEAFPLQSADVVREADGEDQDHEHEPDDARPLHHAQRHRLAAHFLDDGPEEGPPVARPGGEKGGR